MTESCYDKDLIGVIGFSEPVKVDFSRKIRVLITGAGSYIGESFRTYAIEHYPNNFYIDTIDMIDGTWKDYDFKGYDVVFHVAGMAHADIGHVSEEIKKQYYAVNTDLAIETAKKAKNSGVKQFVFMSSMIIYGESGGLGKRKCITRDTIPKPANFYGDSKWQADKGVRQLADSSFNVTVLRPPMIYGKGSKGNYPLLSKIAKSLPVFPDIDNERSMLYIGNLCEFLCQIMLLGIGGVYMPQNKEYVRTSNMVHIISKVMKNTIIITKYFNPFVMLCSKLPGKIGKTINKAFGNMFYEHSLSEYPGIRYQVISFEESIIKTEK